MGFLGFLGTPLGWIIKLFFDFIGNYGWTLVIFTIFIRIVLFPLNIKQQKNTAKMAIFSPKIKQLQKQYANNKEKLQQELMRLYEEEGYSPTSGCLPMLLQMLVLFGIIDVVYRPMQHLLSIPSDVIQKAMDLVKEGASASSSEQLYIIHEIQEGSTAYNSVFTAEMLESIKNFDLSFLGMNLGLKPTWALPLVLIPILSGITSLLLSIYTLHQQKKSGLAQQGMGGMKAMMLIMPVFSTFIAFTLPAGVGLYWIISNVASFAQTFLLYLMYNPAKMKEQAEKEALERKQNAKKKSKFQLAMEAAQNVNQQQNTRPVNNDGLTQSQRIALARKRMAEKYGDDYDTDDSNA